MKTTFTQDDMIKFQKNLRRLNHTITTAESCTGGMVASQITSISGSSDVFYGGIITYANHIKEQELGVKSQTIQDFGVVSSEVVKEMLIGVLKKFQANYAIAISGVAGPSGGSIAKPVGMVVIGIADNMGYFDIETYHFKGSRNEVQKQATFTSLEKISQFVQKSLDK